MADLSWMIRHRFENSGFVDSVAWICRLQGGDEDDEVEGGPFPSTPTPNSFVKYKKYGQMINHASLFSTVLSVQFVKFLPFYFFRTYVT